MPADSASLACAVLGGHLTATWHSGWCEMLATRWGATRLPKFFVKPTPLIVGLASAVHSGRCGWSCSALG